MINVFKIYNFLKEDNYMIKHENKTKKLVLFFTLGLLLGIFLTGLIGWNMMPSMMIHTHKSTLSFDETIEAINKSTLNTNTWKIPIIHDLSKSIIKTGHKDMTKLAVIELCQPHHAYEVLKDEKNKKISAIMPCRIGIYEDNNGDVYISEMNLRLMSKMFGKDVAKIMDSVATEEEIIFKGIIEQE